mgnify:CR=1 FL=1
MTNPSTWGDHNGPHNFDPYYISDEQEKKMEREEAERFNEAGDLALGLKGVAPLKVSTQGQILFLGRYWMTVAEARQLRDWLNGTGWNEHYSSVRYYRCGPHSGPLLHRAHGR